MGCEPGRKPTTANVTQQIVGADRHLSRALALPPARGWCTAAAGTRVSSCGGACRCPLAGRQALRLIPVPATVEWQHAL